MLIGFGVVVGLRLLDWVFPKGYVWVKVKSWSVKNDQEEDTNGTGSSN
jgi:hypothetical protein